MPDVDAEGGGAGRERLVDRVAVQAGVVAAVQRPFAVVADTEVVSGQPVAGPDRPAVQFEIPGLLQAGVDVDPVAAPRRGIAHHRRRMVVPEVPVDRLLGHDLLQATPRPSGAGCGLERAFQIGELARTRPGRVELLGVRELPRARRRRRRGPLALTGRGRERVHVSRLQRHAEPSTTRLDVRLADEPVGRVVRVELRRPHVDGTRGQSAGHRPVDRLRCRCVEGFGDAAPVRAGGIAQADDAATRDARAAAVEITPARLGELGRVGHRPDALAHLVMPRPWRVRQQQPVAAERKSLIGRPFQRPVDHRGHLPVGVLAVEFLCDGRAHRCRTGSIPARSPIWVCRWRAPNPVWHSLMPCTGNARR